MLAVAVRQFNISNGTGVKGWGKGGVNMLIKQFATISQK